MSSIKSIISNKQLDKIKFNDQLFYILLILLNANPIIFKEEFLFESLKVDLIPDYYQSYFKTKFLFSNYIWEYIMLESNQDPSHSLSQNEMNMVWNNQDTNQINQLYLRINTK